MTKDYRSSIALLLALSTIAVPSEAPAESPAAVQTNARAEAVVARIGTMTITVGEIRAAMNASGPQALKAALQDSVDMRLLAMQAKAVVGPEAAKLPLTQRAQRVRAALFAPDKLCRNIPLHTRRQHYDETRWRFKAPPAWTVTDLQWICCESPKDCRTPQADECRAQQAKALPAFQQAVDKALAQDSRQPMAQLKNTLVGTYPRLFSKSYTFYFAPDSPDKKVDWRLQRVDRPVAEAVAKTKVGDVSRATSSRFGHHVLRLLRKRPGLDAPFDDPRTQAILNTELCPQLLIRQERLTLRDLEEQTPMKVFPEVLKAAFGEVLTEGLSKP